MCCTPKLTSRPFLSLSFPHKLYNRLVFSNYYKHSIVYVHSLIVICTILLLFAGVWLDMQWTGIHYYPSFVATFVICPCCRYFVLRCRSVAYSTGEFCCTSSGKVPVEKSMELCPVDLCFLRYLCWQMVCRSNKCIELLSVHSAAFFGPVCVRVFVSTSCLFPNPDKMGGGPSL